MEETPNETPEKFNVRRATLRRQIQSGKDEQ